MQFLQEPKERFHIWKFPVLGDEYLVGGDVGEGVEGGDPSCLQVLHRKTNEQVAVWHGLIEAHEFGRIAYHVGTYYNTALLAIERNSQGITTIDCLRTLKYRKIYKMQSFEFEEVEDTERLGWITNVLTRGLLLGALRSVTYKGSLILNDPDTLAEMKVFVRSPRTGKIGAAPGNHDDRVMALGIATYLNTTLPQDFSPRESDTLASRLKSQSGGPPAVLGRGGY